MNMKEDFYELQDTIEVRKSPYSDSNFTCYWVDKEKGKRFMNSLTIDKDNILNVGKPVEIGWTAEMMVELLIPAVKSAQTEAQNRGSTVFIDEILAEALHNIGLQTTTEENK